MQIQTVAFLPIVNETGLATLAEYELRIPVETIKILKNQAPSLKVFTPDSFLKVLEEKKIQKKAFYTVFEFSEIAKDFKADVYISGKLNFLSDGQISLVLQVYSFLTNEEFYLRVKELPAKVLQKAISQLVALLTQYLTGEGIFFLRSLEKNTKIAIYTNLDPLNFHEIATYLFEKNLRIKAFSSLDFSAKNPNDLMNYWNVTTEYLSIYEPIPNLDGQFKIFPFTDTTQQKEFYSMWENALNPTTFFEKEIALQRKIAQLYDVEYLLFAYAEKDIAFARGIHLDTGELTYLRKKFYGAKGEPKDVIRLFINEILQSPKLPDVSSVGGLTTITSLQQGSDLATVAILDFFNRTGKKEFLYLRNSLSSAVSDSMKRLFEYNRAGRNEEIAAEKILSKGLDTTKLSQVFMITKADYLIFGDFTFNPKTKELYIEARLYDLINQKEIGRVSEKSLIDSRVFDAVDNIAQKMVNLIYKMATQQTGGSS